MSKVYENNLADRLLQFSADVLIFCKQTDLPYEFKSLSSQLCRSATSIGANYLESQAAISRADFRNKVYIAKKEARETLYWIELFEKVKMGDQLLLSNLNDEATQIVKILQTITSKLSE